MEADDIRAELALRKRCQKGNKSYQKPNTSHTHGLAGAHEPNALLRLLSAPMRHRRASWYYLGKHPFRL